ncbi:MAG: caspase family protein [Pseudomonadota bacterium]
MAMLVGVNDYKLKDSDLNGAVNDVAKIFKLIGGEDKGFFPTDNICVLTDSEATYEGFLKHFRKAMVERAKDADQAIFFFAGHGGLVKDFNNDENGGYDQSIILHDSRTLTESGFRVPDLIDDKFNRLLTTLHGRVRNGNLIVIIDACHAGTVTKDFSRARVRNLGEDRQAMEISYIDNNLNPDGVREFVPAALSGSVFLSAAGDEEAAIERNGAGLFTQALINAFSDAKNYRLTYAAVAARIKAELIATAKQTPHFAGALDKIAFTDQTPFRPQFGWEVVSVENDRVRLNGLVTPGMGDGAKLRIYPPVLSADEMKDPSAATATIIVDGPPIGAVAFGRVSEGAPDDISPGDIAIVSEISPSARKLAVTIEPDGNTSADDLVDRLRAAISRSYVRNAIVQQGLNIDLGQLIELAPANGDFTIVHGVDGDVFLNDKSGRTRNIAQDIEALAIPLLNHMRQTVLLSDWRVEGGSLLPNYSLELSLVPISEDQITASRCRRDYQRSQIERWRPELHQSFGERIVLVCTQFAVRVKNNSVTPLKIAGAYMTSKGEMLHFPSSKTPAILNPGEEYFSHLFERDASGHSPDVFEASPDAIALRENFFVIGLPNRGRFTIPWDLISTEKDEAGMKGIVPTPSGKEYGTYSILPIRTEANPDFLNAEPTAEQVSRNNDVVAREYSLEAFNLSGYDPGPARPALSRMVARLEQLMRRGGAVSNAPFRSHDWCEGSDAANLAKGINSPRAIWYLFTRSNIEYTATTAFPVDEARCEAPGERGDYLTTAEMARMQGPMADRFNSCLDPQSRNFHGYQLGDILVYRDDEKDIGHAVMVVDHPRGIGWGAHGWDGDPAGFEHLKPSDGVAFQKIKRKQDWARWRAEGMELKACWRSKSFSQAPARAVLPNPQTLCNRAYKNEYLDRCQRF